MRTIHAPGFGHDENRVESEDDSTFGWLLSTSKWLPQQE